MRNDILDFLSISEEDPFEVYEVKDKHKELEVFQCFSKNGYLINRCCKGCLRCTDRLEGKIYIMRIVNSERRYPICESCYKLLTMKEFYDIVRQSESINATRNFQRKNASLGLQYANSK